MAHNEKRAIGGAGSRRLPDDERAGIGCWTLRTQRIEFEAVDGQLEATEEPCVTEEQPLLGSRFDVTVSSAYAEGRSLNQGHRTGCRNTGRSPVGPCLCQRSATFRYQNRCTETRLARDE